MILNDVASVEASKDSVKQMLEIATSQPHGFLHVNMQNQPRKFYSSFEEELQVNIENKEKEIKHDV